MVAYPNHDSLIQSCTAFQLFQRAPPNHGSMFDTTKPGPPRQMRIQSDGQRKRDLPGVRDGNMTARRARNVAIGGLVCSFFCYVVWYFSLICLFGGSVTSNQFAFESGNMLMSTDFASPIRWRNGWYWRWPWQGRHSMGSAGWLPRLGSNLPGYSFQVPVWMVGALIGVTSLISWRRFRGRRRTSFERGNLLAAGLVVVGGVVAVPFLYVPELMAYAIGGLTFVLIFREPLGAVFEAFRDDRKHSADLCLHCDYDLTGNVSGVCPECGTAAGNTQATTRA